MHVVLMESEEIPLSTRTLFLERSSDVSVEYAHSVMEALQKIESATFDAIVSDDDPSFLRAVRQKGLDVPFIIYTGRGDDRAMVRAFVCGADAYLRKWGDPGAEITELIHRIRSAVEYRAARHARHGIRGTIEDVRCIIGAARIPLVVIDEQFRVVSANPSFYTTFHLAHGDMEGGLLDEGVMGLGEDLGLREALIGIFTRQTFVEDVEVRHEFGTAGRKVLRLNGGELRWPNMQTRLALLSLEDITAIKSSEEHVGESGRGLGDIINFLPDATFAIDATGTVIAWNEAMEVMTGFSATEMLGRDNYEYSLAFYRTRRPLLIDMVAKPDVEIRKHYPTFRREGNAVVVETVMTQPGGRRSILWGKASQLYDAHGVPAGAIESIRDITPWREAESALRASERRFRELVDMLPVSVFEADEAGTFTFVNQNALEIFGYTREDFLQGVTIAQNIVPEERERARINARDRASGTTVRDHEYTALRKDGGTFPMIVYSAPIIREGTVVGTRGVVVDITAEKEAREALRRSEQRQTDIINFLPDATFAIDRNGTVIAWNREIEKMTGIPAAEMIGKGGYTYALPFYGRMRPILIDMVFLPDEEIGNYYTDVRREGHSLMAETRTTLPNGTVAYLWGKATPLFDEQGELVGSIESIRNITELRETEQVLKESEDRYRAIFENSGTAMAIVEEDGTVSLFNSESLDFFGYAPDEVDYGMTWDAVVPDHEKERLGRYFRGRHNDPASSPSQYESELYDRQGNSKFGLITAGLIPGTRRHIVSITDITERKRGSEKIAHLNRVLRALRDVNRTITRESERSRLIQSICDTLIEARGYLAACIVCVNEDWAVTGMAQAGPVEEILPVYSAMDHATLPEELVRVMGCRGVSFRPVETGMQNAPFASSPPGEWRLMSTRMEHAGHIYGLIMVVVPPEIPVDDEETTIFGELATDIAYALYNADLEEERHYHDALKMTNKKLNLLSGITRHDILNQTTVLAGFLSLLKKNLPDDPATREHFGYLIRSVDTIRRQISFTLDYENLGMVAPEWHHVDSLVRLAAASANPDAVRLEIATGNLEVYADPMLEMVFVNLIDNALRHGKATTKISVSYEMRSSGCVLAVEDDGGGVPAARKEEIFEKGVGRNTGYGLFLTKEILGITGMAIRETGEEGKGARFEIVVPEGKWRMAGDYAV